MPHRSANFQASSSHDTTARPIWICLVPPATALQARRWRAVPLGL